MTPSEDPAVITNEPTITPVEPATPVGLDATHSATAAFLAAVNVLAETVNRLPAWAVNETDDKDSTPVPVAVPALFTVRVNESVASNAVASPSFISAFSTNVLVSPAGIMKLLPNENV